MKKSKVLSLLFLLTIISFCFTVDFSDGTNYIITEDGQIGNIEVEEIVEKSHIEQAKESVNDPVLHLDNPQENNQLLQQPQHVHDWSYSGEGNVITATCNCDIGTCNASDLTLTLDGYDREYNASNAYVLFLEDSLAGLSELPERVYYEMGNNQQFSDVPMNGYPKNVGTYKVVVTVGTATAEAVFSITKAPLTASGTIVSEFKIYDGTTALEVLDTGLVSGLKGEDNVTLSATASFYDKNAGDDKTVNISYEISGQYANNYQAPEVASSTASILRKTITVSGTTILDKYYDGTVEANAVLGEVDGVILEDDVEVSITKARFYTAEVGFDKQVMVTYDLSGDDAINYEISSNEVVTGNIRRMSTISGKTEVTDIEDVPGWFIVLALIEKLAKFIIGLLQ